MKKAEVKATGNVSIIPYIAPAEKVEIDEIKSALEVAQENYLIVDQKCDEASEIYKAIEVKHSEALKDISAILKEIRKTEGSYKRSSKRETQKKLYNHMVALREYLETLENKKNFLHAARVRALKNSFKLEEEYKMAKKAVTMAAKQEGFKYVVFAGSLKDNGGTSSNNGYTKTIAEAVSIIYHKAILHKVWHIDTIDGERIADGVTLDEKEFSALIDKYDEKYIDAEFAPVSEKVEYTPATIEEEFNYIEVKAMHNFTLGNYIESIEEMKKFIAKASGDLKKLALSELNEWIGIARTEGVEVEDFNFKETKETTQNAVNAAETNETELKDWEVNEIPQCDWIYSPSSGNILAFILRSNGNCEYYKFYPVANCGAIIIENRNYHNYVHIRCDIANGENQSVMEYWKKHKNRNEIWHDLSEMVKAKGGHFNWNCGEYPTDTINISFTKEDTEEGENENAAFDVAEYLVWLLTHKYSASIETETSKTFEEPTEKIIVEENISSDNESFYAESEEDARAFVEPFKNYYDVKIEVVHFEHNLIGFSGNLLARKGEFKALYISNRWRHQYTRIYNAKIVSNAEVTKKFTQKQIEGIAKYHGLKLKTPEDLSKIEYTYRVEIEIENDGESVKRKTQYAKTFEDAILICKHTGAKLTTYHIKKIDNVREWMAEVAEDKFKIA